MGVWVIGKNILVVLCFNILLVLFVPVSAMNGNIGAHTTIYKIIIHIFAY